MSMKKAWLLILLAALCLALSGCRTRTAAPAPEGAETAAEGAQETRAELPGSVTEDAAEGARTEGTGGVTRENPEADRKEYDENAPAEITAGTERTVHGEGEGSGAFREPEAAEDSVAKLNVEAEKTALMTVAAEEAERVGTAEGAEEAESAMTYFSVLLEERTRSLFECKRLNVYWETAGDHVTVFRTSPEHSLILLAGAYDVSARLLEENLRVDDGWISRKNPDVIVKAVDRSVLGAGAVSDDGARQAYDGLVSRAGWQEMQAVRNRRVILISEEMPGAPYLQTAAALVIAKAAYPEQFVDVDPGRALEMLAEEATGRAPEGIFWYTGP